MSNTQPPDSVGPDARNLPIGGPAPWSTLSPERRRPIPLAAVLGALERAGQIGQSPAAPAGADPLWGWLHLAAGRPAASGPTPGGSGPAAVLVALFEERGEARVLLTRRSENLRTHRGQVSFPGGRLNAAEDASAAALREADEEVGIEPSTVRLVGWLHPLYTMNAALVLPVVGVLDERPPVRANPSEVARVFDVELSELAGDGVYRMAEWDPYAHWSEDGPRPRQIWFFDVEGERVWGATARVLHELVLLTLGLAPG
jgi:8-oxo-dGTP pyrophosphatase MutT (NUDIX family)